MRKRNASGKGGNYCKRYRGTNNISRLKRTTERRKKATVRPSLIQQNGVATLPYHIVPDIIQVLRLSTRSRMVLAVAAHKVLGIITLLPCIVSCPSVHDLLLSSWYKYSKLLGETVCIRGGGEAKYGTPAKACTRILLHASIKLQKSKCPVIVVVMN